MTVPPRRHRAGRIEIENKAREAKKRVVEIKKEVTPEEHEEKIKKLKNIGILK